MLEGGEGGRALREEAGDHIDALELWSYRDGDLKGGEEEEVSKDDKRKREKTIR
jgi:hypothetical protein